ncbi:hypothetical protein [Streptomyces cinereoruber]|uniref:hypothetical protein n=1 Tax=Streptomyces cinereoruber TaxID=67260 RepID=UPI00362EA25F
MDNIERVIRVGEAVGAAMNHQAERAIRIMEEVIAFNSTSGMYSVCLLLAEMGRQNLVLLGDLVPGQVWAMKEPQPHGPCHQAHVFSARLITARANDDDEQCKALFDVLVSAEPREFTAGVMSLLSDVGALNRRAVERYRSA